jgi:hypothetical protein
MLDEKKQPLSLAEWARMAEAAMRRWRGSRKSAADLVIEERRRRGASSARARSEMNFGLVEVVSDRLG